MVPLKGLLTKDLIFLNSDAKTSTELFESFSKVALDKKYVNDKFLDKIIKREATFPTGLELEDYSVAIPHTDADTIEKEFVGVVISPNGIPFSRMDDPDKKISAKVEFVLGLKQPHAQLEMLQYLMGLIQDKDKVNQLLAAKSADEIIEILEKE